MPIMGITAYLDFLWETPDTLSLHRAVLSMDRSYHFHLFTHTFVTVDRPSFMSPPQISDALKKLLGDLHDPHGFVKMTECYETFLYVQDFVNSLRTLNRMLEQPGDCSVKRRVEPRAARLMSYNVWNFNKEEPGYRKRIEDLTTFIAEVDPDVLCLQELRFDFTMSHGSDFIGPNQVDHLTSRLPGYQFIFQPAMSYPLNVIGRVEEGLGILSKHPILSHDYILLPRDPFDTGDFHQRICLHAEILLPNFPVSSFPPCLRSQVSFLTLFFSF